MKILVLTFCALFLTPNAQAYPNFIGYGYNACITCHFNGQGGGALNDYGRALFASEITARHFFPAAMEEEEIGSKSGFIGQQPLPWWIRPGIKYRGLWFQNNPGSTAKTEKFYNMQSDLNLNFLLDKKESFALVTTASYTTYPRSFSTSKEENVPYWFAKEYFLRWQTPVKNLWFYAGQMEKVFGIRQTDHTAASRSALGFGQFDHSQGVIAEYAPPSWSVAGNVFFGNADEQDDVRQKGLSLTGEYEVYEKFRVGASVMNSKSELVEWTRLATFSRMGISKGSSLISEMGLLKNKSHSPGVAETTGAYGLIESWVLLQRGYNMLSSVEISKSDLVASASEKMRFGVGGILFPLPRTEVRAMLLNNRTLVPDAGTPDSWQMQLQLHLSI